MVFERGRWNEDSNGALTPRGGKAVAHEAEQPADVSSSRSKATWYQNTTGTVLNVYLSMERTGASHALEIHINTSQSNNRILRREGDAETGESAATGALVQVPPGHYYQATGNGTVIEWNEQELGTA